MDDIGRNKEILDERKKELSQQSRFNKEEEAKNVLGNREISDRKNENKRMQFERISNLQAEVEILKNQLSSFSTDLSSKQNKISLMNQDLLQKKQRLQAEENKYHAHQTKLKNELKLAEKFVFAKGNAEDYYKQKVN